MRGHHLSTTISSAAKLAVVAVCLSTLPAPARVLDDFNDNLKTGWTDFTFTPGFGLPVETGGQFQFQLPPAGRAIFTASQKTSETFELKDGRTIEFRVDVVAAGGKDSFAILGFLPTANSAGTLAGYGLAKSTTDILITKGIGKYFVADAGPAANLKNENITLVLRLTAKNGSVTITGQALDKDANDAVLWQKTVVDTPNADVFAAGSDSPAAPYITTGYFTLFCYEDFDANAPENPYQVIYDNAEVYVTDTALLDDFNDNVKTDWTDFSFQPGFGVPKEVNGQFRFELPRVDQAIFSASQKTSRTFNLQEGERIEFSVDIVEGGAKDSFAFLAFIPTSISPGTLSGYGIAKSTTDVLLTKGINKYFIADGGEGAKLKQNNITLFLSLTVKNGSVIMNGKVLDKDANNAVLWDKTVVDTPQADMLADGTDSPAEPYITTGYFSLFCYEDFDPISPEDPYKVYYDNAVVSAPPLAANVAPIISGIAPVEFGNFLPASTVISFTVTDDQPLPDDKLSVTLNGTRYTATNGLSVSGSGAAKTASLSGKLATNVNYTAILAAEDSGGEKTSHTIYFDTFETNSLVVEVEDYNFDSGSFINNPVPIPEGGGPQPDAYSLQDGVPGVDFTDTRTAPRAQDTKYRPDDFIRMQHSLDFVRPKFTAAGGADAGVFDWDIGDIAEGEWLNYTRDFPTGTYEVYLRESLANMNTGESVFELVTGDRTQPNPATRPLGSFLGARTGFQYRNFPLTDGSGQNKIGLRLAGVTTLRLRQVTPDPPDGARYQNYLVFIRTAEAGPQKAAISSLSPAPGSTVENPMPAIGVELQNRDTSVNVSTIKLELNGRTVNPAVTSDTNGAVVSYLLSPLPVSGATNTASISFQDNQGSIISATWTFVVTYLSLDPATRVSGAPGERGMKVRLVQAPAGSNLENSLDRAEAQLAPNSTIEKFVETNVVAQVINYAERGPTDGYFPDDELPPGLDPDANGTDDYAMEVFTFLELKAGIYRFGVRSDDGYKIASGLQPVTATTLPLSFEASGTADRTFDVVVPAAGFYPFRCVFFERGGDSYFEWFTVDIPSGSRTLINDPNAAEAVKAFQAITAPAVKLQSSALVSGGYADDPLAVLDLNARRITVPLAGSQRFYRLSAGLALTIKSITIKGGNVLLEY